MKIDPILGTFKNIAANFWFRTILFEEIPLCIFQYQK